MYSVWESMTAGAAQLVAAAWGKAVHIVADGKEGLRLDQGRYNPFLVTYSC